MFVAELERESEHRRLESTSMAVKVDRIDDEGDVFRLRIHREEDGQRYQVVSAGLSLREAKAIARLFDEAACGSILE